MKKAEIYQYLTGKGISYEVTEHGAVYNMEELAAVDLPYPECDAKNLFVRDDKKRNYYLITVKGEKRVNLKEFRKAHGLRNLSFASADDLMTIMGLIPGAVTPLGLLNDEEKKVVFYLDQELEDSLIGVHPNDNTATVWMLSLIHIFKGFGRRSGNDTVGFNLFADGSNRVERAVSVHQIGMNLIYSQYHMMLYADLSDAAKLFFS